MPSSLLFPFDQFQPSELLHQYSEWIYFTLVLVFFISISGIALRKHFDKPYVKPLIISVGLMMTIGVFRYKNYLVTIFEGWGLMGTLLLVVTLGTIPYGLSRGFGLPAGKAFFLSYILIYILSWVKFPEFYQGLGENNLGLINLGLLVLFILAIFKLVKIGKFSISNKPDLSRNKSPYSSEVRREIETEDDEKGIIKGRAEKMSKLEIHSVEDIEKALGKILRSIEEHRNQLPKEERKNIAHYLERISKDENIFVRNVQRLQKLFKRLRAVDSEHLREIKERFSRATGKAKEVLKAEIDCEEQKLQLEAAITRIEQQLSQALNSFNTYLKSAVERIRGSPYPYDAMPQLKEGKKTLDGLIRLIKGSRSLEERLVELAKTEKKFLQKERKEAEDK